MGLTVDNLRNLLNPKQLCIDPGGQLLTLPRAQQRLVFANAGTANGKVAERGAQLLVAQRNGADGCAVRACRSIAIHFSGSWRT